MTRRNERVARIVSFAGVADEESGARIKLRHAARELGAGGFHQHVGGDAARDGARL